MTTAGWVAIAVIFVTLIVGALVYVALKPPPPEQRGSHAFASLLPLLALL